MTNRYLSRLFVSIVAVSLAVATVWTMWPKPASSSRKFVSGLLSTSRDGLEQAIGDLQARLKDDPSDASVAAALADALVRQARVTGRAVLAIKAERVLTTALSRDPQNYEASRMLGVVLLSEHRFRDAIAAAERARQMRPRDAANLGVIGDAYLELGEYDKAFDAFDAMMQLRPSAAAYARVAYAQELQGRLAQAIETMKMAAEATAPADTESLAWHYAQLGDLYFQMGRLREASYQYEHARFVFPDHPFAITGLARVEAATGGYQSALALYRRQFEKSPTPDLAVRMGELYARLGDRETADRYFAIAEAGWRDDSPHPALLSQLLATHTTRTAEAVRAAEQAAADRRDIYTEDALAWAYFKAGRIDPAREAADLALRTGTRDRRVLYHAAEILNASGETGEARRLVGLALEGNPEFDVALAPAATALAGRVDSKAGFKTVGPITAPLARHEAGR